MLEQILVPLDGSPLAECVLPHTITLAQAFKARITLLHVLERDPESTLAQPDPLTWQLRKGEAEAYLHMVSDALRPFTLRVDSVVLEGPAAARIVEYAHGHRFNLIVLSSHGRGGLSDWNVSSVAQKVTWLAKTSIMLLPAYQISHDDLAGVQYRRIMVPLDGSLRAEYVLPFAIALAHSCQASLLLVHAVNRPPAFGSAPLTVEVKQLIDRFIQRNLLAARSYFQQLRSHLPADFQFLLLGSDNVVESLHEVALQNQADLILTCAHGYSCHKQRPYGHITTGLIWYINTPLLVVQDLTPQEIISSQAEIVAGTHEDISGRLRGRSQ